MAKQKEADKGGSEKSNDKAINDKSLGIENLKGFTLGAGVGKLTFIPTGHPQLDYAVARGVLQDQENDEPMDQGGFPLGKLVEIYGEEGSGKSALAYRVIGHAQRLGYPCAWIDAEHSFSRQMAEINGVDIDRLIYSDLTHPDKPDHVDDAEAVIDKMISACKAGIKVMVLDSVAHLTPGYVMENPADKQTVGILARVLSAQLPKLNNYASANGVLVIFINQLREKMGVMYGDAETSPGGRALKHNCSIRLKLTKASGKNAQITIENEEGEDEIIGGKAYCYVKKNRFAAPIYEGIIIPVYYKFYFPNFAEHLFNTGRQLNVIKAIKGVYSYNGMKVAGREGFIEEMQNSGQIDSIVNDVVERAKEKEVSLPAEIMMYLQTKKNSETNKPVAQSEESDEAKKQSKPKKTKKAAESEIASPPDELEV